MARLQFTAQLRRFTEAPDVEVAAPDLASALDAAFAQNPRLRGYVLDDQGQLRPNVAAFVDGRRTLDVNHPLQPHSQVHVLQALSGG
jgi:molybdopterin converting factor small subunit